MHWNLSAYSGKASPARGVGTARGREEFSPSALTWEQNPADHAWHYHHKEGQNLQVGGHQGASFGVGEVFCSERPLNNDLGTKEWVWLAASSRSWLGWSDPDFDLH